MNASIAERESASPRVAEDAGVAQWMEALAAGECTPERFLQQVMELEARDPEVAWEALALLDQHFRRGLIPQDTYASLKSRLQQHGLEPALPRHDADAAAEVQSAVRLPPLTSSPARAALASHRPASGGAVHVTDLSHQRLLVGEVLCGRYRVVDVLNRDAVATLVEAIDESKAKMPGIRQRLAIQVLNEADCRAPESLRRIGRLQALSHPAIPRIFDVEQERGLLLLTMELLKGTALDELLDRGDRPPDAAFCDSILRNVAGALVHAHARGVTHGNVGLANVFVTDLGEARLRGFGVLRGARADDPAVDRLAFAWLAYELLSAASGAASEASARSEQLRKPAGMTRASWRGLRDALQGDVDAGVALLAGFADETRAAGRVIPMRGFSRPEGRRTGPSGWFATAMVLLVLTASGFLYLSSRDRQAAQLVQVAAAAIPPTPVAPEVVPPPTPSVQQEQPSAVADVPAPQAVAAIAPVVERPRIDLPSDATWVETTQPFARIWVRRRGSVEKAVSFQWWTESGSALPERDFHAVAPRVEVIRKGADGVEVRVPLIPDAMRGEARTFFLKIDTPGEGATLGARTLMQVAIVPPGYPAARDSR